MKNNYYDEIISKINQLKQNDPTKALFLLESELNAPYIPKQYEDIFLILKSELKFNINSPKNNYLMKLDDIWKTLKQVEHNEMSIKALSSLEQYALINYSKKIQNIFNQKNILKQIKVTVYEILVSQEINHNFNFKNLIINPSKNKSIVNSSFFRNHYKFINEQNLENELLRKAALLVLNGYTSENFPDVFFYNKELISEKFINVATFLIEGKNMDSLDGLEKEILQTINVKKD